MPALAERLNRAAEQVELDAADLARVLEANPRTVSRWLKRETEPRAAARERLLEVLVVLERLSATLQPAAAHDWLFTPNAGLEYHKPVDLVRSGEFRRVLGAIDALAEGVFV
jgi:putative toxin-antitoxin system antitoxin component (TIGR02293 family)